MSIQVIHCFLVHPEKGSKEKTQIIGTSVPHSGSLFKMLKGIYDKALVECTYKIAFSPNESGEQKNECRDLIIQYINHSEIELAERLPNAYNP